MTPLGSEAVFIAIAEGGGTDGAGVVEVAGGAVDEGVSVDDCAAEADEDALDLGGAETTPVHADNPKTDPINKKIQKRL